ncbi:hypothetical protein GOODEAATRI_006417 [Goodea atripinnis]
MGCTRGVERRCLTGTVSAPYMVKSPPLSASRSDSASPVGLEFWLPGKISVLGERGLSFACSHPSCTTRKGPPYPPLLCTRNTSIGDQPLPSCVCLAEKQQQQQHQQQHLFPGVGLAFFF